MPHPLLPYGWSERVAALAAHAAPAQPARVVRVDTGRLLAATVDGLARLPSHPGATTGDWVAVSHRRVAEILPRWSAIVRRGADGGRQVLAANVDVVLVVAALDRPFNRNRIERELAIAWDGGAVPVVVFTKADLATGDEPWEVTGADVIRTSSRTGEGLDDVRARLGSDRTAALLGPSGAGKTSLVNALLGVDVLPTAAVRAGDQRGRHTTTARHLVPVPSGGVLLDTPGLRSVGLWEADEGVARVFPEIAALAPACRFRDCRHTGEPGCAVVAAMDPDRLAHWQRLQQELAAGGRRAPGRERSPHTRMTKAMERSLRREQRRRGR